MIDLNLVFVIVLTAVIWIWVILEIVNKPDSFLGKILINLLDWSLLFLTVLLVFLLGLKIFQIF